MRYAIFFSLAVSALAAPIAHLSKIEQRQPVGEVQSLLPGTVNGLSLESAQSSGISKRDELTLEDDVDLILDGVGVTGTLDELSGLKAKRQGQFEPIEQLLADGENAVVSDADELLGLDALFPVEKRADAVTDAVGQIETTLEAAPLLEGTVKGKRRDVFEFVDTVVGDAVGQVETTVEAAPLVEGTV
ncbi:hypothetical protein FKW77_002862 [Venturia effusa]|uniref:Uncharacterized protein n=1 Tax=Venturia effusa TaxID=50376 RepID=A0A517LPS3_9PEZI|nr:hypothetical protein FKW77_002862 [Venturia effusa]